MDTPYRETKDRLALAAREDAALSEFGAWRSRVRARVLVGALTAGFALGLGAYYKIALATAQLMLGFIVGGVVVIAAYGIGTVLSPRVVRARANHQLERVAHRWKVDTEALQPMAQLVGKL